jgi:hypothetical protein
MKTCVPGVSPDESECSMVSGTGGFHRRQSPTSAGTRYAAP